MNAGTGVITGVRVSHSTASVDDIAAASGESQRAVVATLRARDGVREAYCLQTCNRAEAYVVTDDPVTGRAVVTDYANDVPDDVVEYMGHEESLRHLLRVAAGLDSLVLGEDQILGQVRTAYEDSRAEDGIGQMLDDAVLKAIHVGERVRTETDINEGVVSLGSAAAELVATKRDLDGATALVVGAGEMATLAARALADRGVTDLVVANRTLPHAEHLAEQVDIDTEAVTLAALTTVVDRADVVVTATGSDDPVLTAADLDDGNDHVVVDLAQPRDVATEARDLDHVTVYDLDTLEDVTEETREQRREAAEAVEALIDEEFDLLLDQYKRKRADEVIAAMYESADRMKQREVETALSKLDLDEEEREVLESMADSLVGQLLSAPTKSLREAAAEDDWTTINTALQLFDPDFGADAPPIAKFAKMGEMPDEIPEGVAEELPSDAPVGALSDDD
ncbi:glutamyl-tRNA reductase [Haloarchaeobius sp. HME9146]|uniref:glutamyl-tRNA reductase n=1 Tax=Haloarchaeobius sp. HME9146 TaxID=2978732 RepID=UPI0021BEAD3C|nr:glutamyl-tRNA reductase [Haloarchaeobius sp. HME9146]MCT9097659.1 glutamyl-tRNA reductase [Haloarchaeobius sp. HME9146]